MIDLHTHSRASDGTESPSEVLEAAAAARLTVVALTDHDTTAGWEEAAGVVDRTGVALVRGTEISTRATTAATATEPERRVNVHLLSYLHDPDDVALRAEWDLTRASRLTRARRMAALLAEDFPVTWEDVLAQTGPDATVGRPHLADALVARGVVPSRDVAFREMLHPGSRYYVGHYATETVDAVRAVVAAGGVPVIAHPRSGHGPLLSAEAIAGLADAGLAGLEVDHRDNPEAGRQELRGLAADLGLLVTGSSDYHGTGKLNRIGENTTSPEVLEQIEHLGRLDVVRP